MNALDRLVQQLGRLPGLGRKSAQRLGYYLLRADPTVAKQLGQALSELRDRIRPCAVCGNYSEEPTCEICQDPRREAETLCVVEQAQDIAVLEASHEFRGRYHVLHGVLAPLDGVGPDQLNLGSLVRRVRENPIKEIILATNPTLEGDTTALYIKQLLAAEPLTVTRLALGLPVGGDLEYADRLTLARSLRARTQL